MESYSGATMELVMLSTDLSSSYSSSCTPGPHWLRELPVWGQWTQKSFVVSWPYPWISVFTMPGTQRDPWATETHLHSSFRASMEQYEPIPPLQRLTGYTVGLLVSTHWNRMESQSNRTSKPQWGGLCEHVCLRRLHFLVAVTHQLGP